MNAVRCVNNVNRILSIYILQKMKRDIGVMNDGYVPATDTVSSGVTMAMSVRKPCVYSPYLFEKNYQEVSKKMQSDFDPIFKIASVFGITFTEIDPSEDTKLIKWNFKKLYDGLINIIAVLSLITTISFAHNFALSNAMMLTYSIKYIGSLLIRLNLLMQSCKLPSMLRGLSELYPDVPLCTYKRLRANVYLQCLAVSLLSIGIIVVSHLSLFYEAQAQDMTQLSISGYNVTIDGPINIVHFVLVAYSLNSTISIFTVCTCVLICLNVHYILRRVLGCFGDSLEEDLKNELSSEVLTRDFEMFRRIVGGINEADEALSFSTFFAYVTCISCFFYSVSLCLLSKNLTNRPIFAVELLAIFMLSIFIFFSITFSASKVSDAVEDFKKRVNYISEIVMKKNIAGDPLLNFMILIDNIKSTSAGMTGWGMFTITRGFVLTTVGVMITYGMILFQFG